MKKLLTIALLICCAQFANAQIESPVTWSYAVKKTSANEATLYLKATIDKGWHLYAQQMKDGGPVKTKFTFKPSKAYVKQGPVMEPKPIEKFEKVFNMNVAYFENSVVFQQKIKLNAKQTIVTGTVEFMVCNDTQCLPPDEVEFSIPVK